MVHFRAGFVAQTLRTVADSEKLEWFRDLLSNNEAKEDQLVLTTLRWAMDFVPARHVVDSQLVAGIQTLATTTYNQPETNPALKV